MTTYVESMNYMSSSHEEHLFFLKGSISGLCDNGLQIYTTLLHEKGRKCPQVHLKREQQMTGWEVLNIRKTFLAVRNR